MTDENRKQYLLLAILYFFFALLGFLATAGLLWMLTRFKYDEIAMMSSMIKVLAGSWFIESVLGIIIKLLTIKFFHRQYNFRKLDVWLYSLIVLNIITLGIIPFLDFEICLLGSAISVWLGGFIMIMLGISLKKIKARLYGYKSLLVYTSIISGVFYIAFCLIIFGILVNFINNIAFGLMFWAASKGPDTLIEDNPPQVEAVTPQ